MKKIRMIIKNPLLWMFTAFAILFVSCNSDEAVQNFMGNRNTKGVVFNAKNYNVKDYSDDSVFRGVMFLDGPVAKKLPDFKEFDFRNYVKDPFKISKVLAFEKTIIDEIKAEKSDYLRIFSNKISSGDFYQVKSAIVDAANIITKKTTVLSNKSSEESVNNVASVIQDKYSKYNTKNISKTEMSSTVWYDTDTVVYTEIAVIAIIAMVAVIDLLLSVPLDNQNNLKLNEYTKGKYLSDVTLNLQGI